MYCLQLSSLSQCRTHAAWWNYCLAMVTKKETVYRPPREGLPGWTSLAPACRRELSAGFWNTSDTNRFCTGRRGPSITWTHCVGNWLSFRYRFRYGSSTASFYKTGPTGNKYIKMIQTDRREDSHGKSATFCNYIWSLSCLGKSTALGDWSSDRSRSSGKGWTCCHMNKNSKGFSCVGHCMVPRLQLHSPKMAADGSNQRMSNWSHTLFFSLHGYRFWTFVYRFSCCRLWFPGDIPLEYYCSYRRVLPISQLNLNLYAVWIATFVTLSSTKSPCLLPSGTTR